MAYKDDITGCKYGRLTAISFSHQDKYGKSYWKFECECGNKKVLPAYNVKNGNTHSCGCKYQDTAKKENEYENGSNLKYKLKKQKPNKNNKLDIVGVYYDTRRNKYSAHIMYRRKRYALGRYNTVEEAVQARKEAEAEILDGTFETNRELRHKKI